MKNKIINIVISLVLGIITILIIPENGFNKYKITQISKSKNNNEVITYYCDIDNDGKTEHVPIVISNSIERSTGNSINFSRESRFFNLYALKSNEFFVSKNIFFADINKNGIKEAYFISRYKKAAYLNIIEFIEKQETIISQKYFIENFSLYNDFPDIENKFIKFTDENIIFELNAGYKVQPRRLYSFNYKTKKLLKSPFSSFRFDKFEIIENDSSYNILITENYACNNTISIEELNNKYSKSNHPDTINLYHKLYKKAYKYGDFSSYTILLDDKLNFKFKPIEYKGWTKLTLSDIINIDGKNYIFSYTSTRKDTLFIPLMQIINFNGTIIRSKRIKNGKFYTIFNNKIILSNGFVYNNKLEKKSGTGVDAKPLGIMDLNGDKLNEMIYINNDKIIIYANDLKSKVEYPIHYCGKEIRLFQKFNDKGKTYLNLDIGDSIFIFHYYKNNLYFLKYPFYIFIIILWYLFIFLILKINTKRLEEENKKLEKIVKNRTIELQTKNKTLEQHSEELKILNENLNQQKEEIQTFADELEKANNTKDKFFSIIAHDLKSPFNTMLGFSQLLIEDFDKQEKDEQKKFISYIYESTKNTFTLLENLLLWARSQRGHIKFNPKKENLNLLINETISVVKQMALKKSIIINNEVSKDIFLLADKNMLSTVIRNLLSNAIKFTPKKGNINIKVDIIENEKNEKIAKVIIEDNGVGISLKKQANLFSASEKTSTKGTENETGTGLGLILCKEFIEIHKGKIWVESEDKKGSKFIFTLLVTQ
jgi:signal transduction histidine kinase